MVASLHVGCFAVPLRLMRVVRQGASPRDGAGAACTAGRSIRMASASAAVDATPEPLLPLLQPAPCVAATFMHRLAGSKVRLNKPLSQMDAFLEMLSCRAP